MLNPQVFDQDPPIPFAASSPASTPILARTSINKRSPITIHLRSFPKTAILQLLLHHKARKGVVDALIVIHLRHETDILIWPQYNCTALFRVNTVMLIRVPMALVVALIIDKDLPIIPAIPFIPRSKDGWEVENRSSPVSAPSAPSTPQSRHRISYSLA